MAADRLTMNGWINRGTLLLTEDALINLGHEHTSDRVRKMFYNRIAGVIVWKTLPWDRIGLVALIVGLPGLLLLRFGAGEPVAESIAIALLLLTAAVLLRYFAFGLTHIAILRADDSRQYSVVVRPGYLHRFLSDLYERIEEAQRVADHENTPTP